MFYLRERATISLEFGVWKGEGLKLQEDSLSMKLYLDPTPRADAQDGLKKWRRRAAGCSFKNLVHIMQKRFI